MTRPEGSGAVRGGAVWDRLALLVWAALALIRILYAVQAIDATPFLRQPMADSLAYREEARAIAAGRFLQDEPFYRAPLYSYGAALAYRFASNPERVVVVTQVLLGLATLLLVWRIARRLYGPGAGVLALLLAGLSGSMAAHETKLLATTLGLFLGTAALALLIRVRGRVGIAGAGFLLGFGALARPTLLLAAPVAALFLVGRPRQEGKRWVLPALLLAGTLLGIAPATLHNLRAGDRILISWNGGMTFYHGNHIENDTGLFSPGPLAPGSFKAVGQAEADRARASELAGRPLRPSEASAFWMRMGLRDLASDPGHAARLMVRKLARMIGPHEYADIYSFTIERREVPRLRWLWVPFPVLLAGAIAGLALRPPRKREEAYVVLFAGLGLLTCLAFHVAARYRAESIPALAVMVASIVPSIAVVSRRRVVVAGGAVAAVGLLALLPPGRAASSQDGIAAAQWGGAWERDDRPEDAMRLYRISVRLEPQTQEAWGRMASLAARERGIEEGLAVLDEAFRTGADGPLLRMERGSLRIRAGDLEGAEGDLTIAHRAWPDDPTIAVNLAACLVRRGADSEARTLLAIRALDADPVALYYRGILAIREGAWAEAASLFERSIAHGATDPRPAFLRAMAWIRMGQAEQARKWLAGWIAEHSIRLSAAQQDRLFDRLGRDPPDGWSDAEAVREGFIEPLGGVLAAIRRAWLPASPGKEEP